MVVLWYFYKRLCVSTVVAFQKILIKFSLFGELLDEGFMLIHRKKYLYFPYPYFQAAPKLLRCTIPGDVFRFLCATKSVQLVHLCHKK